MYKTILTVTVLSEDPLGHYIRLDRIAEEMDGGGFVGSVSADVPLNYLIGWYKRDKRCNHRVAKSHAEDYLRKHK